MAAISFNDLNGKVGVITGGSGVIGTAMVKAMSSVGVKIAIISRQPLEQLAVRPILAGIAPALSWRRKLSSFSLRP